MSSILSHPFLINGLPLWGILIVAIVATTGLGKDVSKVSRDVEIEGSKTREEVRSEGLATRALVENQNLKNQIKELKKQLKSNGN